MEHGILGSRSPKSEFAKGYSDTYEAGESMATMPMKSSRKFSLGSSKALIGVLLISNLVTIGLLIYFFINPPFLYQQNQTRQLVDAVSKVATINTLETPTVAVVSDANKLRGENQIQATVYKDAKDGDYVLAFTDKMVVYRKSENKLVYEGKTPLQIAQEGQKEIVEKVTELAKAGKIIPSSNTETPQLQAVVDPDTLRKQDSSFYLQVKKDDILAFFTEAKTVIIYRPSTKEIVNSGSFQIAISK